MRVLSLIWMKLIKTKLNVWKCKKFRSFMSLWFLGFRLNIEYLLESVKRLTIPCMSRYSSRKPILKTSCAAYSHVPCFCFLHVIMKNFYNEKTAKKITNCLKFDRINTLLFVKNYFGFIMQIAFKQKTFNE